MKIGVTGCTGRVGKLLVEEILSEAWEGLQLAGGTVRPDKEAPGYYFTTEDPAVLFERSDLVIDFTSPDATEKHIKLAEETRTPMVVATTGLSDAQEDMLKEATKNTSIVYASNTSIGVTLLLDLVAKAADKLGPAWDVEINDMHHRYKVDAPSGTALSLGKAVQEARGGGNHIYDDRTGQRKKGDIGYAVTRGGNIIGEHDVTFYGKSERITLSHKAADRTLFAKGALTAAQWLRAQKPGLYSMKDVLGL